MTTITINPATEEDGGEIIDIFNHYVEHSFAAFPEDKLPYEAFAHFLTMAKGYPFVVAKDEDAHVVGFALLRAYHPMPSFAHTAEITYFIRPGYTGKKIGSRLLAHLQEEGKKQGIKILLAAVSALNPGSIAFHQHHGFTECGRFHHVCRKKGRYFDVVWLEKELD